MYQVEQHRWANTKCLVYVSSAHAPVQVHVRSLVLNTCSPVILPCAINSHSLVLLIITQNHPQIILKTTRYFTWLFIHTTSWIFFTVFRLPERGGCHWRDQFPGYQQGTDFPLGSLWFEASHPWGSTACQFGGVQNSDQGGLVWPVWAPSEHIPCECSLLPGQWSSM